MGEWTGRPVGTRARGRRHVGRRWTHTQRGRAQRVEAEKRLRALGVQMMVALGDRDRDEVVARRERRAGEALRAMTEDEGLGLAEVVPWCGEGMTRREAARLRAVVDAGSSRLRTARGRHAERMEASAGEP